jgi:DNA polymerase epsilon subunit 2
MNSTATDRKRTTRIFKSRGLTIQSSALDALLNVLSREANNNSDEALSAIISEIKLRNAKVVNLSLLEEVVAELSRNGRDVTEEALQLLNAYAMPRLEYDSMRRTFSLIQSKKSLIGEASDKVDMFAQRYSLIHQRILRQDIFQPKLVGGGGGTHVLTPVESLLGRSGRKFLLGMIVQVRLFV